MTTALLLSTPSFAAPPAGGAAGPSDKTDKADKGHDAPTKDQKGEARTRYMRGVQLYSDGDFRLALIEFERSYELSPSYKILYNVGQVNIQLNNYAKALTALERYLKEGGDEIPAKRKQQVDKDIENLKARTAHVTITSPVEGATVTIDDTTIGAAPVQAHLVDAGNHKITIAKDGYIPQTKSMTLAGGDNATVDVPLQEIAAAPQPIVVGGQPYYPSQPEKPQQKSYTWVGWIGTGALAAGAAVMGGLALSAGSDLDDKRNSPDATRADIDSAESKARTFAIVGDVLAVSALIVGGVTLYFTLKKPSSSVNVGVGPSNFALRGTF